jgi:hypothetical protein
MLGAVLRSMRKRRGVVSLIAEVIILEAIAPLSSSNTGGFAF